MLGFLLVVGDSAASWVFQVFDINSFVDEYVFSLLQSLIYTCYLLR